MAAVFHEVTTYVMPNLTTKSVYELTRIDELQDRIQIVRRQSQEPTTSTESQIVYKRSLQRQIVDMKNIGDINPHNEAKVDRDTWLQRVYVQVLMQIRG
jgi:hypothetical protein